MNDVTRSSGRWFKAEILCIVCYRMVICDKYDFKKEMIGYDLRRNESVTREYHRRFAPNMYSKVGSMKHSRS